MYQKATYFARKYRLSEAPPFESSRKCRAQYSTLLFAKYNRIRMKAFCTIEYTLKWIQPLLRKSCFTTWLNSTSYLHSCYFCRWNPRQFCSTSLSLFATLELRLKNWAKWINLVRRFLVPFSSKRKKRSSEAKTIIIYTSIRRQHAHLIGSNNAHFQLPHATLFWLGASYLHNRWMAHQLKH